MPHKPGTGVIRGIVSEDGFPAQKRVTLMDRSNMRKLAELTSGADGDYVFSGLDPESSDYLVFAIDDDKEEGSNYKDPIIYDRVQPFQAAIGGLNYNEWFYRASNLGLANSFIPILASPAVSTTSGNVSSGYGTSRWYDIATPKGSLDAGFIGPSPVITELGKVQLSNNVLVATNATPLNTYRNYVYDSTLEWVIDTSNVSGNPVLMDFSVSAAGNINVPIDGNLVNGTLSYADSGINLYLAYNPNRKVIQMGYQNTNGSSFQEPFTSNINNASANNNNYILEASIPVELQGSVIHIVGTHRKGSGTSFIMINGVKVVEKTMASKTVIGGNAKIEALLLGGSPTENNLGSFKTAIYKMSLAALYKREMTEVEAKDLYNALFKTDRASFSPSETGFYYKVRMLRPILFIPMDDMPNESGVIGLRELVGPKSTLSAQTVANTYSSVQSGLITGRSMIKLNQSSFMTGINAVPPTLAGSPSGISFSFVAAPDSITPSNKGVILKYACAQNKPQYSYTYIYPESQLSVWQNTNGTLGASYGNSTANFNHVAEALVEHHYLITLDLELGKAILYVDGIQVEQVACGTSKPGIIYNQYRYYQSTEFLHTSRIAIGGDFNADQTLSPGTTTYYKGRLGAISVHPFVMVESIVEELFDFINVV